MSRILYLDLMEYANDQTAQAAYVTDASGLEIDYMEYASDGAAQDAYVSSDAGGEPPSWDLLDEDCSALPNGWTIEERANGTVIVNPAGQFEFDTNEFNPSLEYIRIVKDIGSIPNTFTYQLRVYHNAIGTVGDLDCFGCQICQGDERISLRFGSDGLHIFDTDSDWTEVGTDLVKHGGSAEWQTWRFLVTFGAVGDGTLDVYLDDSTHDWEKVGTAIPCSQEGSYTDGEVKIVQYGYVTADRITHMDYAKIYDGLQLPGDVSLQCYSEDSIINQGTYSLKTIAAITDSLNETLTKSGLSLNLTDKDTLKFDVYASRTGTNLQMKIHDSGGQTSTKDIIISQVDTWTEITWDISGIDNADKDDIDSIIIEIIEASVANTFYIDNFRLPEGLQCYSEDTIVRQGTYSLKISALQTDALNKTLTKTIASDYLDYSIMDVIKFDIRASRTGSNIKLKIHDTGGTTSEHTINIAEANVWQIEIWDISGITGTDRDTIDEIIIEIINADSPNIIYIDNLYSKVVVEHVSTWVG